MLKPDTAVTPTPDEPGKGAPVADAGDPEEVEEACGAYFRGARERAIALEFRPLAGDWPAPDYALIKNRWWHADGSGFTAEYASGLKVEVRGWGLRAYYDAFLRNRLYRLEARGKDPVREKLAKDAGVPWVHSITVHRPEEEEERGE